MRTGSICLFQSIALRTLLHSTLEMHKLYKWNTFVLSSADKTTIRFNKYRSLNDKVV